MNANGFKKFEHDSPYGRFGFRQNLPLRKKTKHGLPVVNSNAEKVYRVAGRMKKKIAVRPNGCRNRYRRVPGARAGPVTEHQRSVYWLKM